MADEAEEVAKAVANAPEAGGGKKPLVTVLLVLNAAMMGVIAFLQYQAHLRELNRPDMREVVIAVNKEQEEAAASAEDPSGDIDADGILFNLEPFTANLAQGDGPRRFLRLTAVLKFTKSSKKEEFQARKPQIRDTIISILNSKRPEDLLKIEGKSYLKEEIKSAINSFLVDGVVNDVFYVGFQIN